MSPSHLILGGARSGKSRFALGLPSPGARVAIIVTAEARDADMARRIARHRADRPPHWLTVEESYELVTALDRLAGQAFDAILVDCITLWVSNRLLRGDADAVILDEGERLAKLIERQRPGVAIVSNEVGQGVHPETAAGLRFRDLLGLVNQRVAAACDQVTLMIAGLPLTVKSPPSPPPPHELTPQAP
ncbi:MAG TPA: bifunctional adenosylcobinamide kinase/adenosylcobinamide-phosphate guanylyltransferase [Methylomirabilota bacterium]|nr:bifunctional adenosylcobinamide kinase/adenosylcobinamide-phosphate guanylyltransferase [Methylomirabilota bacterium]